ncbi:acyltransferase family protein [Viscerimonas tarda]
MVDTKIEKPKAATHYLWADYARFTCLFLVVFFHIPFRPDSVMDETLRLFRIPCFFFISGLLFRFEKYPAFPGFVKHRAKQILAPYFCFFFIAYVFWLLGAKQFYISADRQASLSLYEPVLEYLCGTPYLILWPLWFLACLFALQCIFYLFFKKIKNKFLAVFILLLFPLLPVLIDMQNAPWKLDRVCNYMPYYGVACFFRKEIFAFFEQKKRYAVALILFLFHLLFLYLADELTNPFAGVYIKIGGSITIIFAGCTLIKIVADFLGKRKYIDYISTNSVVVLGWHTYVIRGIQAIVMLLVATPAGAGFPELSYGINLILAALVMLLLFIPAYLINRYVPFITGKGRFWE